MGKQLNTGRTHFKKGHAPWNKGMKGITNSGSFKKGHVGYKFWLGKNISDSTKEKLKIINLGKKISEKTKIKMSKSHKGKKISEKHKEILRISKTGKNNPMYGRNFSESHRKKISNSHKGSKSYLWKGGVTPLQEQLRKSLEYKIWRKSIFERDKYVCQECGHMGGALEADHIIPFSFILNEFGNCSKLWNIKIGRTLCVSCHKKTDTYMVGARYISQQRMREWADFLRRL